MQGMKNPIDRFCQLCIWKEGYKPISRDVTGGRSSILNEEIERHILTVESDALMRNNVSRLIDQMPDLIMQESSKYTNITLGVVVSNRY